MGFLLSGFRRLRIAWLRRLLILVLLPAVILPACSRDEPAPTTCTDALGCVWIAAGEPLKIGSLHTRSGDFRFSGLDYARGLELAVADRAGQLAGRSIEIVSEDDHCSREGGLTAAQKLASDSRLLAVHGPTCSAAAVPAAEIISAAGMVMISGAATAPSLTSVAGSPGEHRQIGFFRTAPNDEVQGLAAATFAYRDLGVRLAATLNDGDPYTRGLARAFENAFQKLGGHTALSIGINKGDVNMQPVLRAVIASGAQLLFFPIFPPEGDHLVLAATDMPDFQHKLLMSADGLSNSTFLQRVGSFAEGMFFVNPALPETEAYHSFLNRFQQTFGLVPQAPFHAHSFDAAEILLAAIEKALFREDDGSLRFERQTLRDALYATTNFEGLTGRLSCDVWGDCGAPGFELLRLDDAGAGLEGLLNNVVSTF